MVFGAVLPCGTGCSRCKLEVCVVRRLGWGLDRTLLVLYNRASCVFGLALRGSWCGEVTCFVGSSYIRVSGRLGNYRAVNRGCVTPLLDSMVPPRP